MELMVEAGIDLTIFFYNPNIHPKKEYELRKEENISLAKKYKVPFIDADYDLRDSNKKSNGNFIAYLIDNLCREYGFSIDYVLKIPMRQVYQLLSIISERCAAMNGEDYVKIRESDKLKNAFILNRLKN